MIEYDPGTGGGSDDEPVDGAAGAPVRTVDLGTHVVVYFADGRSQVLPKGRFPSAAAGSAGRQGDPDLGPKNAFDAEQSGLSRDAAWRQFVEKMGMDKAVHQERLGEDARQFNEKMGMDKSMFNQRQAVDEGGLTGYFKGANTLDRDKLGENSYQHSSNQAFDYYKRLQDMASNPRNFMLNFFQNRGQEAPANAKAYGNTSQKLSAMQSFEDFLPQFLGSQRRGYGRGASTEQPMAAQAQPVQAQLEQRMGDVRQPVAAAAPSPTEGWNPAVTPIAGSTTTVNHQAPGGVKQVIGLADGWTPEKFAKALAPYANGGVIPEPVVGRGLVSGRPYTFGEEGPEGVVPSNMLPDFLRKRGGTGAYALGGEIGYDAGLYDGGSYAPVAEPPIYDFALADQNEADRLAQQAPQPTYDFALADQNEADRLAQQAPAPAPAPAPVPTVQAPVTTLPQLAPAPDAVAPAPTPFTIDPRNQAVMDAALAANAARNKAFQTPAAPPTFTQRTGMGAPPVTQPAAPPPVTQPVAQPAAPPPGYAPIQQPTQLPQAQPVAQAPAAPVQMAPTNLFTGQAQTNRDVSSPGTFGRSIPGGGPQFLPGEDQTSLQALLASGSLPPFLARLFGQQAGVQSVGTNQGQKFDMPADVPMVSEMALSQMAPTEREAFLSYISSYGIAPEDYLDYVRALGPTGGKAQSPLFGANLRYNRQ